MLQSLYFCKPFRAAILSYPLGKGGSGSQVPEIIPAAAQTAGHPDKAALQSEASHRSTTSSAALTSPKKPFRRLPSGHVAEMAAGFSRSRPTSRDGDMAAMPTTLASQITAPTESETVFATLHWMFASIDEATTKHLATQGVAPSVAPNDPQSKLAGFGRGGKATKGNGKALSSRPSTAMSSMTLGPGQVGKRKDLGISVGSVDAGVVKAFLAAVRRQNQLFDTTAHQDAHEFLNILLNKLGDDMLEVQKQGMLRKGPMAANEKTLVHNLFEGILTNETRCLTCEAVSSRDECFLDLSIDIEHNSSVTSCLRQFSASETLRSRNKFFCDTCSGLQEAEKRMKVRKLPAVLALHMKRFKFEESTQRFVKLAYRVLFPLELRLFNTADDAEDPDRLYELFGIVVHIGAGPHHGHYVSIIKVGSKWAIFDDETVTFIEQLDISKYFGGVPGMGSAYVLFYQAVDLDCEKLGIPKDVPRLPVKHVSAASLPKAMLSPPGDHPAPAIFTRSPANSVSSSNAGLDAGRIAEPLQNADSWSPTLSGDVPIAMSSSGCSSAGEAVVGTVSGAGGFFARRRESATLSQAVENSRSAVDTAVPSSSQGSRQGGWRSPFRTKTDKGSGSIPVASHTLPHTMQAVHLSSPQLQHFNQPSFSVPRVRSPAEEETASISTRASSTTRDNVMNASSSVAQSLSGSQTPVKPQGSSVTSEPVGRNIYTNSKNDSDHRKEHSLSPLRNMMPAESTVEPGDNSGRPVPVSVEQAPPARVVDHYESGRNAPAKAGPAYASPLRRSTMPIEPSASPPPAKMKDSSDKKGSSPAQNPPRIVQTGAFSPMWDRPLSKKEQQKIAKTARRISVSTGLPAGFENGSHSTTNGLALGSKSAARPTTSQGYNSLASSPYSSPTRASIAKGLPVALLNESAAPLASAAPKRSSTLSRAFGLGFGSKKDKP